MRKEEKGLEDFVYGISNSPVAPAWAVFIHAKSRTLAKGFPHSPFLA
jgi:hypothetical protein